MKRTLMTGFPGGRRRVLFLALFGTSCGTSAAELWTEAAAVDTTEWACKYCPYETGLDGEIRAGIGFVADDEFAFGNYTGLDSDGAFAALGADLFYRGEDARYWHLSASRLGLDSRQVRIEGGRQGTYRATVDYTEIPRLHSDTAQTPFSGVGGDRLRLPADWLEAGTTDTLPGLDDSLHTVELRTDRKRIGVGVSFTPDTRWTYSANFKRDKKEGLKAIGGSFQFRGELLPEPVDYTTDQVELGLGYRADRWQVQLGYLGSFFRNEHNKLRWDNPFIEPVGNADEGQLALPPDNTFHQLTLAGNYRISDTTQATARLAAGQMLQDETFLPYTVNPLLATSALPRGSMEGEVRTLTLDARVVSAVSEKLTLQGDVRYNERDNRTPVDSFEYVSTDVFLPGARSNRLYNHTDRSLDFAGRYRLTPKTRLSAGAEYDEKSRPKQEVEETRETTLWAEVATQPHKMANLVLRLAKADRDASDYEVLASTVPEQNPLLVKFNMAEREQERAEAWLSLAPHERLNLGLHFSYRDNDYADTAIGLRSSKDTVVTLDGSMILAKGLSVHAFATRERHENEQAGSQNFSVPDWFATAEDIITSHGVGMSWQPVDSDIAFGIDYVYSEARGEIDLRGETGFPDLKNRIHSANAHVRYRLSESITSELAVFYERFKSEDWMVDDVEPDTVPEVLTLGTESADYDNRAVVLALHYKF